MLQPQLFSQSSTAPKTADYSCENKDTFEDATPAILEKIAAEDSSEPS